MRRQALRVSAPYYTLRQPASDIAQPAWTHHCANPWTPDKRFFRLSASSARGHIGFPAWQMPSWHRGISQRFPCCSQGQEFRRSAASLLGEIGRAHVGTPVTNAKLVCRLLLEKKKSTN